MTHGPWKRSHQVISLLAFVFVAGLGGSSSQVEATPGAFSLGATGVWVQPRALYVAITLNNVSGLPASAVQVLTLRIGGAHLVAPQTINVGAIRKGGSAIARGALNRAALRTGQTYALTAAGSARIGTTLRKFVVSGSIRLPNTSPGEARAKTASAPAHHTKGAPYPARKPSFSDEDNGSRWVVPTGPTMPGTPTKLHTALRKAPHGDPPGVTFNTDVKVGITGSTVAEPSGANGGGVVFMTSNWYAAYTTNGAPPFTQLNPTTIFPSDAIGYCCDQIVQYVPSINTFVWLLQGNNGYRLAAATPAQIISGNGTAWTYWDLPSTLFGEPSGTGFDYPDLAVGNNYVYMSWDTCWPGSPAGCNSGHMIVRAPLSEIQSGGTLNMNYTTPSDSTMVWGGHLSQDTGDTIFWAGHNSNTSMRVFSWPESTGTYSWRDVGVSSWDNNTMSSTTPDGQDWMSKLNGFPGHAIIGATRLGSQLWLAWSAGTDKNQTQPHVEMVTLDTSNGYNKTQQVQVWNNSYAFGYPALATATCTSEVAMSFEYGGNGNYENHVVGFWGDYVAYITTNSNVGSVRFGDYVTIRQDPTKSLQGRFFDAFGYGMDSSSPTTDTHYVQFGRSKCG
jgi:hypothetical protein